MLYGRRVRKMGLGQARKRMPRVLKWSGGGEPRAHVPQQAAYSTDSSEMFTITEVI